VGLLAALCAAGEFVRWAGLLQWLVIGGLLIRGQIFSRSRIREFFAIRSLPWIAFFVSLVVTVGTFLIVRHSLQLTHDQLLAAKDAGVTFDEQAQPQGNTDIVQPKILNAPSEKTTFTQEMIKRVRESGK